MSKKFALQLTSKFELEVNKFGAPIHSDDCPEFDGKRCKLMGFPPGNLCEPAIGQIIDQYEYQIKKLQDEIDSKNTPNS